MTGTSILFMIHYKTQDFECLYRLCREKLLVSRAQALIEISLTLFPASARQLFSTQPFPTPIFHTVCLHQSLSWPTKQDEKTPKNRSCEDSKASEEPSFKSIIQLGKAWESPTRSKSTNSGKYWQCCGGDGRVAPGSRDYSHVYILSFSLLLSTTHTSNLLLQIIELYLVYCLYNGSPSSVLSWF